MNYLENIEDLAAHFMRWETIVAIGVALAVYVGLIFARAFLRRFLRQQVGKRDSVWLYVLLEAVANLKKWSFAVAAVFVGVQMFELSPFLSNTAETAFIIALVVQVAMILASALDDVLMTQFDIEGDETRRSALSILSRIGTAVVWALAFLFALSNLGIDTTSLIAGLGVGGIAVALALQGILSDLLSAFTVFFDKPFEVGDFIGFKGEFGTVKSIGIMTTRIELLSGEELVVTNQDLTTNMVENLTRLQERRVSFTIGTVYELSADTVAEIPTLIREIIESREHVRFGRAHFKGFGDSALLFEIVYFVEIPEHERFMDIQQEINVGIMRMFEQKGVALAYPTQTVYVKGEAS